MNINYKIALAIAEKINDEHTSIFMYGSRARGDYINNSDLDLIIVCSKATFQVLAAIRKVCQQQDVDYEINPQVITQREFKDFPKEMGLHHLSMEGVLLYGNSKFPLFTVRDLVNKSMKLLTESLMSVRHYLVSEEIKELTPQKVSRYIKKPLLHGLRFHHFVKDGLCNSNEELKKMYPQLTHRDCSAYINIASKILKVNQLILSETDMFFGNLRVNNISKIIIS